MNETIKICKAFNDHAWEYERFARVPLEIGKRLFERLDYLKITPNNVLDLGCGSGFFLQALKKKYPKAHIYGLDIALNMLKQAKKKQFFRSKWSLIQADMTSLPFACGAFDLVFANQVMHWSYPLKSVLNELNRVMAQDGCFMFSTLGPDTFIELKQAFAMADTHAHVNEFLDMHDVGDSLQAHYFVDCVVDMERLTAHYRQLPDLLQALKAQGVRNIHQHRNQGLTGKATWQRFKTNMNLQCTVDGKFPLTYEVVYGHAWKGTKRKTDAGIETSVSIDTLMRAYKNDVY